MAGSGAAARGAAGAEGGVEIFERAEEAGEGAFEVFRAAAGGAEIAVAELVRDSDDGGSHRAVFVSALSPDEVGRTVDPDGESHALSTT